MSQKIMQPIAKVIVQKSDTKRVLHVVIESLSDELQFHIRESLSEMCFGCLGAINSHNVYSYSDTIQEFYSRFEKQTVDTKKGMVGELVTHFFIKREMAHLAQSSPFINMEERSIKKGFDVVYFDDESKKIWLTEVKAGAGTKGQSYERTSNLVARAKNDIKNKFQKRSRSLWQNAINGVVLAVREGQKKHITLDLLHTIVKEIKTKEFKPENQNAILSSVLFCDLTDNVTKVHIEEFKTKIDNEKIFADLTIISIQKNTFDRICDFLKKEAENAANNT